MSFTEIANNITVMYGVFLIAVLLTYIAFFKRSPRSPKGKRERNL